MSNDDKYQKALSDRDLFAEVERDLEREIVQSEYVGDMWDVFKLSLMVKLCAFGIWLCDRHIKRYRKS